MLQTEKIKEKKLKELSRTISFGRTCTLKVIITQAHLKKDVMKISVDWGDEVTKCHGLSKQLTFLVHKHVFDLTFYRK